MASTTAVDALGALRLVKYIEFSRTIARQAERPRNNETNFHSLQETHSSRATREYNGAAGTRDHLDHVSDPLPRRVERLLCPGDLKCAQLHPLANNVEEGAGDVLVEDEQVGDIESRGDAAGEEGVCCGGEVATWDERRQDGREVNDERLRPRLSNAQTTLWFLLAVERRGSIEAVIGRGGVAVGSASTRTSATRGVS